MSGNIVFSVLSQNFSVNQRYFDALNEDKTHFVNSNDICTPLGCVKEMVDVIPQEFWQNRDIKVLDSCCGNGNFHAYIQEKTNLKNLFFNDTNKVRLDRVLSLFGEEARDNITNNDFLTFDCQTKYDLIVSNPPYAKITNGKRASKNHNLARAFIKHSLKILKPKGYLLFIVPNNWMSFSDRNDLPCLLRKGQFRHLSINKAKKWFPKIGSSFTWFLWQKTENKDSFPVENGYRMLSTNKVRLRSGKGFDCVPLFLSDCVESIFAKTIFRNHLKYPIETSSDLHHHTRKLLLSKRQNMEHPYRLIHTPLIDAWSCRPHKYQEGWKVFIPLTHYYKPFVDKCGMTQSIAFIRCSSKDEAYKVKEKLEHPLYKFLNDLTRYGNFNNIRVLQRFPVLENVNLTKQEWDFIRDFK